MAEVRDWADTAAGNNLDPPGPPDYPSEDQPRSSVNNTMRENMAAVRRWAQDGGWFDHGDTYQYVSATTYQVQNGDFTGLHFQGRAVRAKGTPSATTIYGIITKATFASPHTDVVVQWSSGSLQNETLEIFLGPEPNANGVDRYGLLIGDAKFQTHTALRPGYFEMDGQALVKADYPVLDALYSADSYPWGSDATTFNLPNMNGRAPIGRGQGNTAEGGGPGTLYAIGDLAGAERDTLDLTELPEREVTQYDPFSGTTTCAAGPDRTVPDTTTRLFNMTGGSGQSHNNQSPVLAGVWVIRVI